MKSGIYKITNTVNGKVYIGQAKNLNTRFSNHLYRIKKKEHHNEYLQRAFEKYGEANFIYEIVEEISDLSILDSREKYWIDHYGGINSNDTYNLKDPLLNEHNDYVKSKLSNANSGENNPNYGNKWTDEQKENMSKSRKGKSWEELYGKNKADKMRENSAEAQRGREHSEETIEKIRQANVGEKNPAYGKGDRQKGEKNPNFGKASSQRKFLLQFNKEGDLIKEYKFLSQVKDDGFHIGNVASAARGELKSSGGFIWKYKE